MIGALIFLIYATMIVICVLIARAAKKRGKGFVSWIVWGILFTPVSVMIEILIYGLFIHNKPKLPDIRKPVVKIYTEADMPTYRVLTTPAEYFSCPSPARAVTEKATYELEQSLTRMIALPNLLTGAETCLWLAEKDFSDRAFGPFWDDIEGAVDKFAEFDSNIRQIKRSGDIYQDFLSGTRHNFPPFPTRIQMLPDPQHCLTHLHQLVRQGSTDYQFASIWENRKEHRKTQAILEAGFRGVSDAIDGLGWRIEQSLHEIAASISTRLESLENLQAESNDDLRLYSQNMQWMLNNIQRGRKPITFG